MRPPVSAATSNVEPESEAAQRALEAKRSQNALHGRKSAFKRRDDGAEVHEYPENCRRTAMHCGGRTLSEPGIQIWTPSNDLAQSRRRESLAPQVPGCQWMR